MKRVPLKYLLGAFVGGTGIAVIVQSMEARHLPATAILEAIQFGLICMIAVGVIGSNWINQ